MSRGPAAALALLLAAGAAAYLLRPGAPVRVDIPEGLGARRTAELLGERKVVPSVPLFRALLKVGRWDRRLQPGSYAFRERESPFVLIRKLTRGQVEAVRVTVPEGFRAAQIAERLGEAGVADPKAFLELVGRKNLEGRLFPSTYHFPAGYGAERAAAKMLEAFDAEIGRAYAAASPRPVLSLHDALVVASIVEREAVMPQERPVIAAVYLNRLLRRMPLQADPTVQYALGAWKKRLSREDLKIDSPYNTYARRGLPPGPICSPGLGSFQAVLSPARTGALYFVADAKGGHVFSETNEEHAEARQQYKKAVREFRERQRREQAAGR